MTELVAHDSQYDAAHRDPIIEPLLISISDCSMCIDSWLFRCRIRYHISDPFMLQDYLQLSIPATEVGSHQLIIVQQ